MKQVTFQPADRGVVLIVVLIMLVIIGLTSVSVMRNALTADLVSNNVRAETLATEAAQAALAYCEQQAVAVAPQIKVFPATNPPRWKTLDHWLIATPSADAPAEPPTWKDRATQAGSVTASVAGVKAPQCIAEQSTLADGNDVIVVTARGFTPDYKENNNGRTESGAAVWLQSTLRIQ